MIGTKNVSFSFSEHRSVIYMCVFIIVFAYIFDYGCKEGRFLVSPRGVAISNRDDLSSSETWGLILGYEAEKSTDLCHPGDVYSSSFCLFSRKGVGELLERCDYATTI